MHLKAAVAMVSGIDDPTQLGIRDRLGAYHQRKKNYLTELV